MKLHELIKLKSRNKKKVGRGIGSGKGKTATRGTKGQKARGKIPIGFTGNLPLYKKLPLRRGLGNPKLNSQSKVITLSDLNVFPSRTIVDVEQLLKMKIINEKEAKRGVKVLATGELEKALTVKVPVSKGALAKISQKGGKVENV